jgi:uncharacterized protein (DUF488 family)
VEPDPRVLTIGHSNHALDVFLDLLRRHQVQAVVDTRSQPYSKYTPHFDAEALRISLPGNGIRYIFMGKELGGRPVDEEFYDDQGRVLYGRVAESRAFREGLSRLEEAIRECRVALLCGEENPAGCHRRLLVTRVLAERGVTVDHIRADGRLQSESELTAEEARERDDGQLDLFEYARTPEWKSIPSVSPKKRPRSSSPR